MHSHADEFRQEGVVLHFQHGEPLHHRDIAGLGVEEIQTAQAGTDVSVQGDAHIARRVEEGLPVVAHHRFRPQALSLELAVQLPQQGMVASKEKGVIPCQKGLDLFWGDPGTAFGAQAVDLALLLQPEKTGVGAVVSKAELRRSTPSRFSRSALS